MLLLISALGGLLGSAGATAHAGAAPVLVQQAIRVHGPVTDAVWAGAPAVDAFVQREPQEGGAPSQRTEFRVAYDSTTFYVRVRAYDTEPQKIVGYLTRRDQDSPCDWLRVMIDSYHDRRTAYEFAVNPSGVKFDRYWYNDNTSDDSWDAVWDVSVSIDSQGWSAEFRIPFSQLRFTRAESNTFGFAVARTIGRLNETSTWPLLARSAPGYVSSFGEVSGLTMAAPPRRLELLPYTVADLTRQRPAGNPLLKASDPAASGGVDLKYAITPGLTLTATVNPDFGQVEADPAVVNLTAFETFFAERRPFFVEGSGTFAFNVDCNDGPCSGLFYSRRIGRSPQGLDALPSGTGIYTNAPGQTRILGAAKITGRVGRYSVGVIQAETQAATAEVFNGSLLSRQPVEPSSSYSVGRIRREFDNQSSIGLMVTSTSRHVPDSLKFLADTASAAGVDVDWRFRQRYSLTGYWVGSTIHGDPQAIEQLQENSRHYFQRPDLRSASLDPRRTSLSGAAGQVAVSKIAGEHTRFTSTIGFKTPGFDINDVGFLRRADQRSMMLTPNLSLQLYGQPFVSTGDYGGYKAVASPRGIDYASRYAPFAYDVTAQGDPTFNVKSFRTTNVLRWEYRPGSTLFVVWQQARENDAVPGGFRFGRDIHDIFGVAPRSVFLVKLAYWLNY